MTASAAGTIILASGSATASHAESQPDHVTITADDTAFLRSYRPYLDLSNVPYSNRPTLYGWKATSNEHETDVAVYVAKYAVQRDVLQLTSHVGDHEWVYVFVNDDGTIDQVAYTAYHWLRGYVTTPSTFVDDDGPHARLEVAPTYHNYLPTESDSGVLLDVEPLGRPDDQSGPFYRWLDNGMEKDLAQGSVHNPWLLDSDGPLSSWWSKEGTSQINIYIVSAWAFAGIAGADNADLGEAETSGYRSL